MNTEQKLKNLLVLKNEIDKEIADLMLKQKEKWQPKGGDFSIVNGRVAEGITNDAATSFGMAFETRQDAEKAAKAYRKYHRLYKLAEELNPDGWEPNWGDPNQPKYIIRFNKNYTDAKNDVWYESEIAGAVFFASITAANKAIEILMDQE